MLIEIMMFFCYVIALPLWVLRTRVTDYTYFVPESFTIETVLNKLYQKTIDSHTTEDKRHMAELIGAKWTVFLDFDRYQIDVYPKFLAKANGDMVIMSKIKIWEDEFNYKDIEPLVWLT